MPEPQDIAALRERLSLALRAAAREHLGLADGDYWDSGIADAQVDAVLSEVDAERERGRALRAAVEALAEELERAGTTSSMYASYADLPAIRRRFVARLRSILAANRSQGVTR